MITDTTTPEMMPQIAVSADMLAFEYRVDNMFRKSVYFDPMYNGRVIKVEKKQIPSYLEGNLLSNFIDSIKGKYQIRNVTMFLLMSYAGLRVSELSKLNISDFNHSTNVLKVNGKGRKWRTIPLPKQLVEILKLALEERIQPYKEFEQAFFVSQFGRRITIRSIQKIAESNFSEFKLVNSELQDKPLSSHKLRHTFATLQVLAGTDIKNLTRTFRTFEHTNNSNLYSCR